MTSGEIIRESLTRTMRPVLFVALVLTLANGGCSDLLRDRSSQNPAPKPTGNLSAWRPNWETTPDRTKKAKARLSPTLTFTEDWLGAVPVLDTDEQKKLHQRDTEQKELFIQAFRRLSACKGLIFMRSDPKKADFDVQVFNGLDGRTGRWQWVLYRTDITERLGFGEETVPDEVAKNVCITMYANTEPLGGKVE
jgi:hypothetical protein